MAETEIKLWNRRFFGGPYDKHIDTFGVTCDWYGNPIGVDARTLMVVPKDDDPMAPLQSAGWLAVYRRIVRDDTPERTFDYSLEELTDMADQGKGENKDQPQIPRQGQGQGVPQQRTVDRLTH